MCATTIQRSLYEEDHVAARKGTASPATVTAIVAASNPIRWFEISSGIVKTGNAGAARPARGQSVGSITARATSQSTAAVSTRSKAQLLLLSGFPFFILWSNAQGAGFDGRAAGAKTPPFCCRDHLSLSVLVDAWGHLGYQPCMSRGLHRLLVH